MSKKARLFKNSLKAGQETEIFALFECISLFKEEKRFKHEK